MEVILLTHIENLGSLGDKVNVKSGFARNFLVPQGKAKPATVKNLAEFEERRAELEKAAGDAKTVNEGRKRVIEALGVLEITARVGSEDKLFGSVGIGEVADAINEAGGGVEKRDIRMPEGSIRTTGEHQIDIHLHTDIDATVTINIVGED
jgi:large subunit ribosomal protein L9